MKLFFSALVDPGHITIPLCSDPEVLGRRSGYGGFHICFFVTLRSSTDYTLSINILAM